MTIEDYLMGRRLLKEEIPLVYQKELESSDILRVNGIRIKNEKIYCNRCGLSSLKNDYVIKMKKRSIYYCPNCLLLGRIDSQKILYFIKEKSNVNRSVIFEWQGTLTKGQKKIAHNLVESLETNENQLVHAVTGAGKTEMLFPLIKASLEKGKRVAVVSPRMDVCLEIYPRLKAVFPDEKMCLLYGASKEPYQRTSFIVATTHQMLRFYHSFDVIVIDEVDAFPFANNPVLMNAVERALKKEGMLIYLTATPDEKMLAKVKKKQLVLNSLSKRYHGHPLPQPTCFYDYFLLQRLSKGKLSPCLITFLNQQTRQCLIFFSNINRMKRCFEILKKKYPHKKIAFVYAGKEDREAIIIKMRKREIDWLLTTTILERGVTFTNIDVVVYEADHAIFNTASLVQMAGRVGRKAEYPNGQVIFIYKGRTRQINQALNQIKQMNKEAGFL